MQHTISGVLAHDHFSIIIDDFSLGIQETLEIAVDRLKILVIHAAGGQQLENCFYRIVFLLITAAIV